MTPDAGIGSAQWARAWAQTYEDAWDAEPEARAPGGRPFTVDDLSVVLAWKLRRVWPKSKIERLGRADPAWVEDVTSRAFAADDLAAACLLDIIPGIGFPAASAILRWHDPVRYTVAAIRAWRTLTQVLGRLRDLSDDSWPRVWLTYLAECRSLTAEWGMSLRDVDRVLWAAKGQSRWP